MLSKASTLQADVLLLDLQDSVPMTNAAKCRARDNVGVMLRARDHRAREVSVRINGPRCPWILEDVRMAVEGGADSITLPDASGLRDLLFVEGLLELQATTGNRVAPSLMLEVETPETLCELEVIAAAAHLVDGLCVAPYDYAVAVNAQVAIFGGTGPYTDAHLTWLRPKVVAVARANQWSAVDAVVVSDPKDPMAVRQAIAASRSLGFDGSAVLHPSQIQCVNDGYSPTSQELAWAHETLSAGGPAFRQPLERARRLVELDAAIRGSNFDSARQPAHPVETTPSPTPPSAHT